MENDQSDQPLVLLSLASGMAGLTPAWGAVMAEAASVCLEERGHDISSDLTIDGDFERMFTLCRSPVDDRMRRSHHDQTRATEHGACGVSLLALNRLTGLAALHQSRRGTGFDYWLGPEGSFLFQGAVRLEVSGIRNGDESTVRQRVRMKEEQVRKSAALAPAYVAVVEFSRPLLRLVKR